MVLDTEYYSEEPVSIGGADENGEDDHGDGAGGGGSTGPGGSYTPPAPPPEAIAPGGKPLSARLYDELARQRPDGPAARKSAGEGKRGQVRVGRGGGRILQKKKRG